MKKYLKVSKRSLWAVAAALFLFSACSKDDAEPEDKGGDEVRLEEGGTISARINGEAISYEDVRIVIHGLSNNISIQGRLRTHADTMTVLHVTVPLEATTGSFDHSDAGFDVKFEVITHNNESGYYFNREKTSSIAISSYEAIGEGEDGTFYRVKGSFSHGGMRSMSSETVAVENGSFDFVYSW